MFWLGWISVAVAAPCVTPVAAGDIEALAGDMISAFQAFDEAAFEPARDGLFLDLGCVTEPLSPLQAARVHLATGVAYFTLHQDDLARAHFDAARATDASVWRAELAPVGHPLELLWSEASLQSHAVRSVLPPASGTLWFDGREGRERPVDRATLVQHERDGTVAFTAMVGPAAPLPRYEPRRDTAPPRGTALRLGGVGLAAAGGGLYAYALGQRQQFDRYNVEQAPPAVARADLHAYQTRANGASVAAGVAALLGVGAFSVSWGF